MKAIYFHENLSGRFSDGGFWSFHYFSSVPGLNVSVTMVTSHSQNVFLESQSKAALLRPVILQNYLSIQLDLDRSSNCFDASRRCRIQFPVICSLAFQIFNKCSFTKNESSIFSANLCDSSCTHWWPLMPAHFYQTSWATVTAGNIYMCITRNTELPDIL